MHLDEIWSEALEEPMDEAVTRLKGIAELIQNYPRLEPATKILRSFCAAWLDILPGENTCRSSVFELRLDQVRGMKMGDAVYALDDLIAISLRRDDLARERDQMNSIRESFELLNKSRWMNLAESPLARF